MMLLFTALLLTILVLPNGMPSTVMDLTRLGLFGRVKTFGSALITLTALLLLLAGPLPLAGVSVLVGRLLAVRLYRLLGRHFQRITRRIVRDDIPRVTRLSFIVAR